MPPLVASIIAASESGRFLNSTAVCAPRLRQRDAKCYRLPPIAAPQWLIKPHILGGQPIPCSHPSPAAPLAPFAWPPAGPPLQSVLFLRRIPRQALPPFPRGHTSHAQRGRTSWGVTVKRTSFRASGAPSPYPRGARSADMLRQHGGNSRRKADSSRRPLHTLSWPKSLDRRGRLCCRR
jgi:hypothetical protein